MLSIIILSNSKKGFEIQSKIGGKCFDIVFVKWWENALILYLFGQVEDIYFCAYRKRNMGLISEKY
jgi:hypothetical protein